MSVNKTVTKNKLKITVLASGAGSTFEAILQAAVHYEVIALITNKEDVGAIEIAKKFNINSLVAKSETELLAALSRLQPDYVVLAGYLKKISGEIIDKYKNKIINTHPSLLPKFGGKGMYGRRVHEAVMAAKERMTGATVHWVTEEYDAGPIIKQENVVITPKDTVESIERKVKICEKLLLTNVLNSLGS